MAEKDTKSKATSKPATKAQASTKAKSAKSTKATPKPKTKPAPKTKTIDEYMAPFPEEVRGRLQLIRMKVQELAPAAKETISYGIPTFKLNDTYLVYFGGWKDYISMYPLPEGNPEFDAAIEPYKAAKAPSASRTRSRCPYRSSRPSCE